MEKTTFRQFSGGQPQQSPNPPTMDTGSFDVRNRVFPSGFQNSAVSGGYWTAPGVFQHPPPQQMSNIQRPDHVQAKWGSFTPRPDYDGSDLGCRVPYPQYQHSFAFPPPNAATMRDVFDPTRPPPPLPFRSEPTLGHRSHDDTSRPLAEQGYSVAHAQVGGHSFSREFKENSRPHLNQSRFAAHDYNRTFPEGTATDSYGSPELERLHEQWSLDHRDIQGREDGGHLREVQLPHIDAETAQRHLDQRWLSKFLLDRQIGERSTSKRSDGEPSISQVRETLYSAARTVSQLSLMCQALKKNVENESFWTDSYAKAVAMRDNLQHQLSIFSDPSFIDKCKKKTALIRKKRARIRRKRNEQAEERKEEEARTLEKEAYIDKWRMKRIQKAEEKKRELELREAADSVLSEVRKKQADAKRMLDILRSLEKLRKLRKEAAARKGVYPEKEADETFESDVDRLRKLIRKRTVLYAAEENALRVMLEGEQEQERKREQEKRQRKEREKQLQKKQELEAMLFGDEMPPDHPLQPFRQYYCQADLSLHTLIQTRRQWDQYLVPADHPDGSFIPQGWVLPEAPSDEPWSTALDKQVSLTD
ncbi:programmed cell death protein 7 [Arapaima gigas]